MLTHRWYTQVLRSWKTRRVLDADLIDAISADLEGRRASYVMLILNSHSWLTAVCVFAGRLTADDANDDSSISQFSKNDILRRIEDDRERVRFPFCVDLGYVAYLFLCHSTNDFENEFGSFQSLPFYFLPLLAMAIQIHPFQALLQTRAHLQPKLPLHPLPLHPKPPKPFSCLQK